MALVITIECAVLVLQHTAKTVYFMLPTASGWTFSLLVFISRSSP